MLLAAPVLLISAGFLFAQLGHYPLWADEADTALFARGIMRTGDTSALQGQNIYAYRDGALLRDLKGRYQPPASYYLAAPFVGTDNTNSFWPRFPFAVCGLLCVASILYWLVQSRAPTLLFAVMALGILGNVSFFLYCRQCRYYALVMLLTVLIVYLYLNWKGSWWKLTGMTLASLVLLASHYMAFGALYAALAIDYFVFRRSGPPRLKLRHWVWLLLPQILVGLLLVWIYNPLALGAVPAQRKYNWFVDKLVLLWWNFRDMNLCEFGAMIFLAFAPLLYFLEKNVWLIRAPLAALVYILTVTFMSPQPLGITTVADVRYLAPLIPLLIFIAALEVVVLCRHKWPIALPVAALLFGTNLLNLPWNPNTWHCTVYQLIQELSDARLTPSQRVIDWINDNVEPAESIWVMPNEMTYTLMYHAPQAVYAWQLEWPPAEQFKQLSWIHFLGQVPPDFILSFGPQAAVVDAVNQYRNKANILYTPVSHVDIYFEEGTRPELMWRSFKPVMGYNPGAQAIFIWRRQGAKQKL